VEQTIVLTALFETIEDGSIQARVEELREVITFGHTREEAEAMLIDALREYFLSFGHDAPKIDAAPDVERSALEVTFRT
jgi:predicted RNase H-like HicB family nuclease